ncbi:hypothetical protein FGB62_17g559 [Gracilaria domingensis]|nr:hypothetical protein FGB62_17g559 [Gracilaria domingensis]
MVVMRRLLPDKETLRGRDLAAYRDVANLAFTCPRLLSLFRMVRTTPVEVFGLFNQIAIDPSPQGQIRYPPICDIRFFRNLLEDSGTALRRLSIPFLPAVHTSTLIQLLFSVCFHLEALYLADAGTLLSKSSELLSKSPIDHLRIYFPSVATLASLSSFEKNPIWHCNISGSAFDSQVFENIKKHEALTCRRHKRKLVIKLRDSSSVQGVLKIVHPILVPQLSLVRFIEKLETEHEPRLIVTTSDASDLGILLLEKVAPADDVSETEDIELRTLYIRSYREVDLFLRSNLPRKEAIQREVKGVHLVDVRLAIRDRSSCDKLLKCLLELFDEQNEVINLQISREIFFFSHIPEVLHLMTRFKTLKRIHFSEPIRTLSAAPASGPVTDKVFLEHLPTLLCVLQEKCHSLETVNMSSCFPAFPFEKREELRPGIHCALSALAQLENNSGNFSVDGIRRVLLMWLERVNLER